MAKLTYSDVMKSGEGSRGGHIIGHTKSGKPIYGSGHDAYNTEHKVRGITGTVSIGASVLGESGNRRLTQQAFPDYDKHDHLEAEAAHREAFKNLDEQHLALVNAEEQRLHAEGNWTGGINGDQREYRSGGAHPKFSEDANNKIRATNSKKFLHRALADAHYQASFYLKKR